MIELMKIPVSVWRIDTDNIDIADAAEYHKELQRLYPDRFILGIPTDKCLDTYDREELLDILKCIGQWFDEWTPPKDYLTDQDKTK